MPESEQYKDVCKERLNQIDGKLDKLYDKLFEDNGGDCLQTKVNINSRMIKLVTGIFATIGAALLALVGYFVKSKL